MATTPFNEQAQVVSGPGGDALLPNNAPPSQPQPVDTDLPPLDGTSVITSDPARETVQRDTNELAEIQRQLNEAGKRAADIANEIQKLQQKEKPAPTPAPTPGDDAGTDTGDNDTGLPELPKDPDTSKIDADMEATNAEINKLRETMDERSAAMITAIQDEYNSLIQSQKLANKQFEGGITVEGFRSGRARYAPIIQSGIFQQTVNTGLSKIADLEAKKKRLVMEAQQARDENDVKLLSEKMENYRETIKEQREAAQQEFENVMDLAREAREQQEAEMDRQKQVSEYLAGAIVGSMTDSDEANADLIMEVAEENDIDPNLLISKTNELIRKTEKEERSALPQLVREYEYAVQQGHYTGSFTQYQVWRKNIGKSAPKSKVLSLQEAVRIGFPQLEGVETDELIRTMVDDKGKVVDQYPQWFYEIAASKLNYPPIPSKVQELWDEVKGSPELKELTTGKSQNFVYGYGAYSNVPPPTNPVEEDQSTE